MAEEMYETLQTQTKHEKYMKFSFISCIICTLLLTGLLSFTIYYVVENPPSDHSSVTLCETPACVSLADEIISSINESVDPCEDFYHYSCDGWIERNMWRLIDDSTYSQFGSVAEILKQNFLDEMFWYENEQLVAPDPVQKAKTFFDTCYKSTSDQDDLMGSDLLQTFIQIVNFSIPGEDDWDNPTSKGFSEALAWLNQREWNSLFSMGVYFKNDVSLQQNEDFWSNYKQNNTKFCNLINSTFVPLFMDIYDTNETDAQSLQDDACGLFELINSIGVYPDDYLNVGTLYSNYFTFNNFSDFQRILPDSDALNMTEIIYQTFDSQNVSEVYYFGDPDINFLKNLSVILNMEKPVTVQLLLFTNVLWYYLDYADSWEEAKGVSRRDFCYDWTVDQFPFVFGYITGNTLYNDDKFNLVTTMAASVQNDGILQMIEDADWLDDFSRAAAEKKALTMGLFVGYPDSVFDADGITDYYKDIGDMDDDIWLNNVETMNDWQAQQTVQSFTNDVFKILDQWPIIFSQRDAFKYWLTGVNAFYYPGPPVDGANFFTIPTTITQEPFLNIDYPSAVNFGGLGSVCGHEMSHGFDPEGFQYNYNGTNVGSILSDKDTRYYNKSIQCYIDQYNGLRVRSGDELYVNGTRTQRDNVADNVGLQASYLAWNKYKTTVDENSALPGVSLNDEQLFFWSWAHLWCSVTRPNAYDNYTNEHSPHYTRVIGSLQNSQEFQDAFQCQDSDFMSRENKCSVW